MRMDAELAGELAEFLDDTLLRVFAEDQGVVMEWAVERVADGYRCLIKLDDAQMPPATAIDEQTALEKASVLAIEQLTWHARELEPELAFG